MAFDKAQHMRNVRKKAGVPYSSGKPHKKKGPNITHKRLLKAIKGSHGIVSRIAKRLGVVHQAVTLRIKAPGYERCLEALEAERESLVDDAEKECRYLIRQRKDLKAKGSLVKFVLQTKGRLRGYQESKEVTIQGGDKPLQINAKHIVSVETLPLDLRRNMMKHLESHISNPSGTQPTNGTDHTRRIIIRKRHPNEAN